MADRQTGDDADRRAEVACKDLREAIRTARELDWSDAEQVIAAAIREAVAAERERCAGIAETVRDKARALADGALGDDIAPEAWVESTADRIAQRIREASGLPLTTDVAGSPE